VILFILPLFAGGGAERVTLNILTGLHSRNHTVGIIVFNRTGPLLSIIPDGVPIYDLETYTLKKSIIPLVRLIRKLEPEVVFSTLGYINISLLSISWLFPRKTKIWIREANLPSISLPNNSYRRLMPILYRILYRKADKLICTSKRMKKEFISDFLISGEIIEVLPNPVDIETIRKSILPIKYFDRGGVRYIASGRLTFQKGFDRLLHWFSELEDIKSTLTILGDGELKDELTQYAESLNILERVKFVGFCNNPWKWYAGADVFLLPSRWEGMPNVVLESLVCGTPVIATQESGGIREIDEQSQGNSVNVAISAQQFVRAMNEVQIKDRSILFPSLISERYEQKKIFSIVEGWLN
jgi:glycosyltransferase involved in cell wall biosynthesis